MKKYLNYLFYLSWFFVFLAGINNVYGAHSVNNRKQPKKPLNPARRSTKTDTAIKKITKQATNLSPHVLQLALRAYEHARQQGLDPRELLTVINYKEPSTDKRLWVINMKNDKVLYNTYVAHGKGSGNNYATHFSNQPQTHETSLGVYLTGQTYYGNDGYSMRLRGLEPGFNNNAYSRDIVMHGAWYVSKQFINKYGRLGRSWGCPALSKKVEPKIVHQIKDGTLLFAYYPEKKWLDDSKFLKPASQHA